MPFKAAEAMGISGLNGVLNAGFAAGYPVLESVTTRALAGSNDAGYTVVMSGDGVPPVTEPPGNVDVPQILVAADDSSVASAAVGTALRCTMGNWSNTPDGYAYAWLSGTDAVGTDVADYTIAPTDLGKAITCVVTASNALGETVAPPSNAITVA